MSERCNIEVVLHGASNSIGSHRHPILESGNLAFPKGRYFVNLERDGSGEGFCLTHRLEGTPLLARLIADGKAQFACTISSPRSAYRKVHLSSMPRHSVNCDAANLGEPPLFTPSVLCVCDTEVVLDSDRDGVHEIWHGQTIELSVGSRVAVGNVIQLVASITHLLSLHADENLPEGAFAIDIESEPFGFRADLHPHLHTLLRHRPGPLREHLMIHIVTACLARLQKDYSGGEGDDDDADGESNRQLKGLADLLESKGIPHWSDEAFRPEKAATILYPIVVPADASASEAEASHE